MTERCVSCNLPLSTEAELERLRQEVKDLKGDLRSVVRELNMVLHDRSIGHEISVRKTGARPALHALERRREARKKKRNA